MTDEPIPPRGGLLLFLAVVLACVDVPALPIAALSWLAGTTVAAVVGALVAIVLGVAAAGWLRRGTFVPLALGVLVAALAGTTGGDVLRFHLGTHAIDVAVADAPSHAGAASYRFVGGVVRTDLEGRAEEAYEEGDADSTFTVVPLVPDGWSPDAPVPVWVGTGPTSAPLDAALRDAVPVPSADAHVYARAVLDAEVRHGLHGDPAAPIVHLTYDLGGTATSPAWILVAALVVAHLVLVPWCVVEWSRRR